MTKSKLPTSMNIVQVYRGQDRKWYLRLVSRNGQVLAQSEGYYSKWNAKRAARRNFVGTKVVELERGD